MAAKITVDEFYLMTIPPGMRLELRDGVAVPVPIESTRHSILANSLSNLFDRAFERKGMAGVELSFRAKPEYELLAANVGWISEERERAIDLEDYLHGAPDIAVEIMSKNKSIDERKRVFFEAGCREFWVVDPLARVIEITESKGSVVCYGAGERILIGDSEWLVDEMLELRSAEMHPI